MSYNGTGIYTLPGAQLINGEVVSATENNQFRNDVATALNTAWTRDGQAPATNNIPMANHKFTGLLPGTENGDSVRYEQVTSDVDITGGTIQGVTISDVTLTGDFAFDSITTTGNATIGGDISSDGSLTVALDIVSNGTIETTGLGIRFSDDSLQTTAYSQKSWNIFDASGTFVVPAGVKTIRAYAFGAGGNGYATYLGDPGGGGGGGCAFGDIAVSPGDTVTISIVSGVAKVSIGAVDYLTANKGASATSNIGGAGGTATKHASVTNGGAYSGGAGGSNQGGGGASGSPLGIGGAGSSNVVGGGGGGAGGPGGSGGGGGAGGGANGLGSGGAGGAATSYSAGVGRLPIQAFSDPLLAQCFSPGESVPVGYAYPSPAGNGAGGAKMQAADGSIGATGGMFGGGGGAKISTTSASCRGGQGGFGGGGGCATGAITPSAYGGNGGYGGGGGGAYGSGSLSILSAGAGGPAIVLIYA